MTPKHVPSFKHAGIWASWVFYGSPRWPSHSVLLIPGTIEWMPRERKP